MSAAPTSPEAALCAAYREQAERYRAAVILAETFAATLRDGRAVAEPLGRVTDLLSEIAAAEQRLAPLRERWLKVGGKPGTELRAALSEVTHLIERLACGLVEAEREATGQQAQIVPEMEALVRGRAMRQAYRCASR